MASSEINLNGVEITTHVIDSAVAVDKHITDLRRYLECNAKVVGLDLKTKLRPNGQSYFYKQDIVVLCVFRRCLIFNLSHCGNLTKAPQSLDDFMNDPKICFVGATTLPDISHVQFSNRNNIGVTVGDLAARVLRKPQLTESSLVDIAKEAAVPYRGEGATAEVVVASESVWTDEEIKSILSDAYAYYQIGFKLLTSL